MADFISYLFHNFSLRIIPISGGLAVLVFAIIYAIKEKQYPLYIRLFSIGGFFLLFLVIATEMLQPALQFYLEDELNIIFLEADKYTSIIRNLRYLLYPVSIFIIGFALFDDRFEDEEGTDE